MTVKHQKAILFGHSGIPAMSLQAACAQWTLAFLNTAQVAPELIVRQKYLAGPYQPRSHVVDLSFLLLQTAWQYYCPSPHAPLSSSVPGRNPRVDVTWFLAPDSKQEPEAFATHVPSQCLVLPFLLQWQAGSCAD